MRHPIAKRFKQDSKVIKLPLISPKHKYFNIPEGKSLKPPGAPPNVKIRNEKGKLFNFITRKLSR